MERVSHVRRKIKDGSMEGNWSGKRFRMLIFSVIIWASEERVL